MFDPDTLPKGPAVDPEPKRHLGLGHITGAILHRPQVRSKNPNRRERRIRISLMPRNIRVLAKQHRDTSLFAHKPHPLAFEQWLDPEQLEAYQTWTDEEKATAHRRLKNALKKRRHTPVAATAWTPVPRSKQYMSRIKARLARIDARNNKVEE